MQREWKFPPPEQIPPALQEAFGNHTLLPQLLLRRQITSPSEATAFLDPDAYQPASPAELPGMELALERIISALKANEKICIWGDFDVDGQTSTAVLVEAIRGLGGDVDYYIPIRAQESHGIGLPSLERVIRNGARLIVTCDTGISAHLAVAFAREHGVDMVITDHHELSDHIPEAIAVVNPRMLDASHALATLPGVGVAYKLAECLYDQAGRRDELESLLDLVALGIIADVALLHKDTRYLAQRGIEVLRHTDRLGLRKLFGLAELNPAGINEEHIGFVIGPRLNALGRLSDANKAVDFLTTSDDLTARLLAIELEGLNAQRQLLTSQVYQAALAQVERDRSLLDSNVLVLGHPAWPAGVIGIVASRLVEQLGKPVVLLSTPPNEPARGSARSIEGVSIIEAITTQKDLLESFGGHPMAAGLSMNATNIDRFRVGLSQAVARQTGGKIQTRPLFIEAEVGLGEISLDMVRDIERLAPFGAGNPKPIFVARNLVVESDSTFGRAREHRTLSVTDSQGAAVPVVWWQGGNIALPEGKFDLAFTIHATTYRGLQDVQIEWIDSNQQVDSIPVISPGSKREVIDFRDVPSPQAQLDILRSMYPEIVVWTEGEHKKNYTGQDRLEVVPAAQLAILTRPPSRAEIDQVIKIVEPEVVFLLSLDPDIDTIDKFMPRLAGLVNFSINKYNGVIDLNRIAAACAQRLDIIQAGLKYLAARGMIQIGDIQGASVAVIPGDRQPKSTLEVDDQRLVRGLAETKAFRKYYHHADPSGLL